MIKHIARAFPFPRTMVALAATGSCILTLGLVNTDGLVEHGFASALAAGSTHVPAPAPRPVTAAISGSEEFWLRGASLAGMSPAAWSKPATQGQRITISANGHELVLEVVDVRPLGADVTRIDTAVGDQPSAQPLLVTCREVGATDGASHPIRFVVEPNSALPWVPAAKASHAL